MANAIKWIFERISEQKHIKSAWREFCKEEAAKQEARRAKSNFNF